MHVSCSWSAGDLSIRRADTVWARMKGWLGRRRLDSGEALWLTPCRAVHTLGMRMPIDVVFLDAWGAVVRIVPALVPGRAVCCLHAASVLELAAGTMRQPGARSRVERAMKTLIEGGRIR